MLAGHPAIAQVHTIDRGWKRQGVGDAGCGEEWRLLRQLRARRYRPPRPPDRASARPDARARCCVPRWAVTRERSAARARVAAALHALLPAAGATRATHGRGQSRRAAPHRHLSRTGRQARGAGARRAGAGARCGAAGAAPAAPSAASSRCIRGRAGCSSAGRPSAPRLSSTESRHDGLAVVDHRRTGRARTRAGRGRPCRAASRQRARGPST